MKFFTTKDYWNKQYTELMGVERVRVNLNLSLVEIDGYFKKFLPVLPGEKFLEIGCAPGRWMHYFKENFQCQVEGIEYTHGGVIATKKNLEKLHTDAVVHEIDFFENQLPSGSYGKVFSFGFIEHFDNISLVMDKHWSLVSKKGFLIVGIPNLRGINEKIQHFYSPEVLAVHNLKSMNLDLYKNLDLPSAQLIDVRYCGKLNLTLFGGRPLLAKGMSIIQLGLTWVYFLLGKRFIGDNKNWSPYIFMIFKKV